MSNNYSTSYIFTPYIHVYCIIINKYCIKTQLITEDPYSRASVCVCHVMYTNKVNPLALGKNSSQNKTQSVSHGVYICRPFETLSVVRLGLVNPNTKIYQT